MSTIHPAVRYVQDEMRALGDDNATTGKRAHAIVMRLISAGFIIGAVDAANRLAINKPVVTSTKDACMKQFDDLRDDALKTGAA